MLDLESGSEEEELGLVRLAFEHFKRLFNGPSCAHYCSALLEDLFTVREIRETSQRLGVARLLAAGKSYAAIEAETGASATTIARVSKCLSYGAGGYEQALKILDARP